MATTQRPRTTPDFNAQRIAAQRYRKRWEQMAAQGAHPVVINRRDHPEQWRAWLAAHRLAGRMASVDLMLDRSEATVPCLNPHDFDLPEAPADRRVKD
ncbi:hypothetical protein NKJ06_18865 [Mesorhizobium sp. M0293]|uniref:hypothetical protein n=1 Tax=Mesorhizobium sp. M0293 TaxID=2956930 RepID=UPI00333841DA